MRFIVKVVGGLLGIAAVLLALVLALFLLQACRDPTQPRHADPSIDERVFTLPPACVTLESFELLSDGVERYVAVRCQDRDGRLVVAHHPWDTGASWRVARLK